MNTITVNKANLIETLILNRDEHRAIFEKATTAYRAKVIEALDRALADAKAGGDLRTYINLPVPEDHTDEFDTAIAMLEWDTADTVELTRGEFQQYVENQWGWRASFAANTMSYSSMLDEEEANRG